MVDHFAQARFEGVPDKKQAKLPHYHGHRARLRERFLETGRLNGTSYGHGMPDYELLEMLLATAIPRKDVKPLAKELIDQFGSLNDVLTTDPARLSKVKGISETAATTIRLVYTLAKRLGQKGIQDRHVLSCWEDVVSYCHTAMAHETREQFRLLFLDSKNHLIADEVQQVGTVNHMPVYPREVVKRALVLNATALILVHNHPSGDPAPSPEDIDLTKSLSHALAGVNIAVHDHLIIGKAGHFSFRERGMI